PAANFAIRREALGRHAGVDGQLKSLAAKWALNRFGNLHLIGISLTAFAGKTTGTGLNAVSIGGVPLTKCARPFYIFCASCCRPLRPPPGRRFKIPSIRARIHGWFII